MQSNRFPARLAPYLSEANHSNEQDVPERSSDDTENDVHDQVPTEENRNNTGKDAPAPSNAVVSRKSARQIKAFHPVMGLHVLGISARLANPLLNERNLCISISLYNEGTCC